MALTTYTELKASLADWLNRTDLTAAIPDFITLAESQMERQLRLRQMMSLSQRHDFLRDLSFCRGLLKMNSELPVL